MALRPTNASFAGAAAPVFAGGRSKVDPVAVGEQASGAETELAGLLHSDHSRLAKLEPAALPEVQRQVRTLKRLDQANVVWQSILNLKGALKTLSRAKGQVGFQGLAARDMEELQVDVSTGRLHATRQRGDELYEARTQARGGHG